MTFTLTRLCVQSPSCRFPSQLWFWFWFCFIMQKRRFHRDSCVGGKQTKVHTDSWPHDHMISVSCSSAGSEEFCSLSRSTWVQGVVIYLPNSMFVFVDSCSSCRCFSSLLHFINVRLSNWDTLEPQTCRSAGLVKITSAIREEITTSSLSADSRPEVSNISSFLTTLSQSSLLEVLRTSFTEAMWSWCCAVQIKLISFNTEEKSSSYKLIPELSGCFQERLNVQRFVEIKIQTHELFNIINDSIKRHAENQ